MNPVKWLLLASLALLLPLVNGCVSPADRLEPSVISAIQPTKTTRQEAETLLGKPEYMVTSVEGRTLAKYSYMKEAYYGTPSQIRVLSLLYNRQFLVERMLFSDATLDPHTKLFGLSRLGTAVDRETILKLMKPGALRNDIIAELGKPTIEELNIAGERIMTWVALQEGVPFFKRMESQTLTVRLDPYDILLDYSIVGTLEPEPEKNPAPQ